MAQHPGLKDYVRQTLRAEKARRQLTFQALSQALAQHGIRQTATNLSTKFARGDMSAQLFLALMKVLQVSSIRLDDIELPPAPRKSTQRKR